MASIKAPQTKKANSPAPKKAAVAPAKKAAAAPAKTDAQPAAKKQPAPAAKKAAAPPAKKAAAAARKPAKILPPEELPENLSLIVAVGDDGAIGKGGSLPWQLPADLQFFKKTTMGKPMLMGRRTFESFRKPLPGRLHIVLSSHYLALPDEVVQVSSMKEGMNLLRDQKATEVFIIGGAQLYKETLQYVQTAYVTRVHTKTEGADTFFDVKWKDEWKLVWKERHEADEKNPFAYTFQRWERRKPRA